MKAFASALTLAASAGAAAQTVNGLRPAKAGDVVAATQTCVAATLSNRVDEALLRTRGWQAANLSVDGRTAKAPVRVYGRKGGNAIIMLATEGDTRKLCTVMARVSQMGDFGKTGVALTSSLGSKPVQVGGGSASWLAKGKVLNMQATGSRDKPAVRISVMAVPK